MKSPKLEHNIQNEIRIWCGEHDIMAVRCNVGTGYTADGRVFNTGLPEGWPDLQLLTRDGKIIFCECKTKYGRLRPAQIRVHAELNQRKFKVLVPHSFEQFVEEIENEISKMS